MNLTVVYYTDNREKPEFERKIRETLVANSGGLPIISVSQKPIELGFNICVGDIGVTPWNMFKQVLIGAEMAETDYICTAEADSLYPPDYFQFQGYRTDMFYLAAPLYVLYTNGRRTGKLFKKPSVESACIVGRDHLIKSLKYYIAQEVIPLRARLCDQGAHKIIHLKNPIITCKTGNGMHWKTPMNDKMYYLKLPYWGSAEELVRRYCENTTVQG